MKNINPILQWWVTPKLPREYVYVDYTKRPKNKNKRTALYLKRWVLHPITRRIAKYYLIILRKIFSLKVIAITGSAGKTSTKNMVASILKNIGNTESTYKNIDPIYNIPKTILKCRPSTKYLVLEMGVELPGEMDFYLWMAKPDIGVITNIFPTHTEYFKDIKGVSNEKLKLVKNLSKYGFAVLNSEDKYLKKVQDRLAAEVVMFGKNNNIFARNLTFTKDLKIKFEITIGNKSETIMLPVAGAHFVENALAAASVCDLLGASINQIKSGLENFEVPEHRMRLVKLDSKAKLIDDSYNNNPEAAKATLSTFNKLAEGKFKGIVFGDMLELGKHEKKHHQELGKLIAKGNYKFVIGVGPLSSGLIKEVEKANKDIETYWCEDQTKVDEKIRSYLKNDIYVLVKGSRSIALDKFVARLSD